jgi:hypothetical protein
MHSRFPRTRPVLVVACEQQTRTVRISQMAIQTPHTRTRRHRQTDRRLTMLHHRMYFITPRVHISEL